MPTGTIRLRNASLAVRLESAPGTWAFTTNAADVTAADFIGADVDIRYNYSFSDLNEANGSIDAQVGIPGPVTANLTIRVPLRGTTQANLSTGPEWGRLLECATMEKLYTASAVGTPTAAAAGTTTTITLASPFGTTANQYVGMPLNFSGDITNKSVAVTAYTAGRVATMGNALGATPTTSTLVQLPPNNLWSPAVSEGVMKTASIVAYKDGIQWQFLGATGSWRVDLQSGRFGYLIFEMVALPSSPTGNTGTQLHIASAYGYGQAVTTEAMLATAAAARVTPVRFTSAVVEYNRAAVPVRSVAIACEVATTITDNPATILGIDPPTPTGRRITAEIDPFSASGASEAFWNNLQTSTAAPFVVRFGGLLAGTRFMVTVPAARVISLQPGQRDELAVDTVQLQAEGLNTGAYVCCW